MQRWLSRGRVALAIVVIVNVALAAAYLWSRHGQTTVLRLEARGDQFTASVDGHAPMSVRFPNTQPGGIELRFVDQTGLNSLPHPSGVDSVQVTDLDTGELLFEDDFSGNGTGAWQYTLGTLQRRGGLLQGAPSGRASLLGKQWTNVAIEVRYRNVTSGTINIRAVDDRTFVEYHFTQFQHMFQQFVYFSPTEQKLEHGPAAEPSRVGLLRSLTAMALRPYPLVVAVALIALVVFAASSLAAPRLRRFVPAKRRLVMPAWAPIAAAWAIGTSLLFVTMFINTRYSSRLPHWPDAVSYVFQARIFASGHLAAAAPRVVPPFDYFYPTLTPVSDGHWSTVFPFGHPLLLAIGERLGAMWIVPSLLAEFSAVLLFLVGRRLYGAGTGIVAALLFATSPFVLMQSSNFMSHSSAVFYLLCSLALILLPRSRVAATALLAGICFGLLFNTRPLSCAALVPAFALLLLVPAMRREENGLVRTFAFAAGGLAMLGVYFGYNFATSGDIFNSNYRAINETLLGFGGAHSVSAGMQNDQTNLAYLLFVLNGWPQYVGLLFVLMPFALGTTSWRDWWCLLAALPVLAVYTLFGGNGVMQGPRLWYEAVPFLMLLTARGGVVLAESVALAFASQRERWHGDDESDTGRRVILLATYACLAALMSASLYGWLLGRSAGWRAENVPATASGLRGFDRVDDRTQEMLAAADLHNALVLVEPCLHWECYGTVFWMNTPSLDGDVVYARNLPDHNAALFRTYPDRQVYTVNYGEKYIAPFGATVPSGYTGVFRGAAPRAADLVASGAAP